MQIPVTSKQKIAISNKNSQSQNICEAKCLLSILALKDFFKQKEVL